VSLWPDSLEQPTEPAANPSKIVAVVFDIFISTVFSLRNYTSEALILAIRTFAERVEGRGRAFESRRCSLLSIKGVLKVTKERTLHDVARLSAIEKTRGYGGCRPCVEFVIGRSSVQVRSSAPAFQGSNPETWVTGTQTGVLALNLQDIVFDLYRKQVILPTENADGGG